MNIHEFSGIPSQLSRNVLVSLGIKVGPRMRILDHIKTNRPSSSSTYSSPPINTITPSPQCLGVQSVDNNSIKTSHGFVGYSVTCEPAVCASDVSGPSTYAENFVQVEASDVVNKTATVDDRKSRLDRAVSKMRQDCSNQVRKKTILRVYPANKTTRSVSSINTSLLLMRT